MNEKTTVLVASIVTTLHDLDTDCAESTIYLGMGMDLPAYEKIRQLLVLAGLVTVSGNRISLTSAGKVLASEINSVLA